MPTWPYKFIFFLHAFVLALIKGIWVPITIPPSVSGMPLFPLYRRGIDPSSDAWSDTIAGIGPLILLVGEQSTKQLLCTVTGIAGAFSLATAPLGLLTIVTSLLRLCGMERLRAFIGHDLEARTVAAVEMTRVNCGGVYAELLDGYLIRNTNGHPAGVAIGVSMVEGDLSSLKQEVVRQVMECELYKERKRSIGMPDDCAQVRWCIQVTTTDAIFERINEIIVMLAMVHGLTGVTNLTGVERFQRRFCGLFRKNSSKCKKAAAQVDAISATGLDTLSPTLSDMDMRITTTKLTYALTFDAVSEFTTTVQPSRTTTTIQGCFSMLCILTIHFLALWKLDWSPTSGWILGFLGYIGIVLGVIGGSMIIHSSCEYITLQTLSSTNKKWVDGIIFSALAPESMDTSGSPLWSTLMHRPQKFEAVWRKDLSSQRSRLSSMVAFILASSYVCHYLGLRSLFWWVSSGELLICVLSAFVRSIYKDTQERFKVLEGVKMDKRCSSTGIIRVQVSERISPTIRMPSNIDVRAYDELPAKFTSADGERIAWYIASENFKNREFRTRILDLTGLFLEIVMDPKDGHRRIVFVSFKGGILVQEGLAYPDARIAMAFRCSASNMGAPTPLLSRAIMRQPRWLVEHEEMGSGNIPLGNVHVFSINSMMSWWTISEDRNDMADIQKHLNWPMLLVNVAFFMSMLTARVSEPVATVVDKILSDLGGQASFSSLEKEMAVGIVNYIKKTGFN